MIQPRLWPWVEFVSSGGQESRVLSFSNNLSVPPLSSRQIDRETMETGTDFIFLGSKITAAGVCSNEIETLNPWKKSYDHSRWHIKKQRHILLTKFRLVKAMVFPLVMYGCVSWAIKKDKHRRIDDFELEKCLENLLDYKEIQPVHPKGSQHWIFIAKTDAKAEALILWPPDAKSRLIRKDSDAGKDWGQEEKWTTEDEMVEWHHWLNGHEFEQTLGVGDGQGSLACCSPWGHEESDTTEWLNWTELRQMKRNYCIVIIGHLALYEYISSFGDGLFIKKILETFDYHPINNCRQI